MDKRGWMGKEERKGGWEGRREREKRMVRTNGEGGRVGEDRWGRKRRGRRIEEDEWGRRKGRRGRRDGRGDDSRILSTPPSPHPHLPSPSPLRSSRHNDCLPVTLTPQEAMLAGKGFEVINCHVYIFLSSRPSLSSPFLLFLSSASCVSKSTPVPSICR